MIRLARQHLEARASERPADYLGECSRAGRWEKLEGDVEEMLVLTDEAYAALVARYAQSEPKRPGWIDMTRHFATSIAEWAAA
ncbi:MAG: hypothetical protein AABY13_05630, partial [Nanoarchaeota archaeon]